MANQALIAWIAIGLVAGVAGSFLFGGGVIRYLIAGMLGALIAGWAADVLNIPVPIGDFWIRQVVIAAVGGLAVVLAARSIS